MYFIKPLFFFLLISLFSFMEEKAFSMEEPFEEKEENPGAAASASSSPPPLLVTEEEERELNGQSLERLLGIVLLDVPGAERFVPAATSILREKYGLDIPPTINQTQLTPNMLESLTSVFHSPYEHTFFPPFKSCLKFPTHAKAYEYLSNLSNTPHALSQKEGALRPEDCRDIEKIFSEISPPLLVTVPSHGTNSFMHIPFFEDYSLKEMLDIFLSSGRSINISDCLQPPVRKPINRKEEHHQKMLQLEMDEQYKVEQQKLLIKLEQDHRSELNQEKKSDPTETTFVPQRSISMVNYLRMTAEVAKALAEISKIYRQGKMPESELNLEIGHPLMSYVILKECLLKFQATEEQLRELVASKTGLVSSELWQSLYNSYAATGIALLRHNLEAFMSPNPDIQNRLLNELYFLQELVLKMQRTIVPKAGLPSDLNPLIKKVGFSGLLEYYLRIFYSLSDDDPGKPAIYTKITTLLKELKSVDENEAKKYRRYLDNIERSPQGALHLKTPTARAFARRVSDTNRMESTLNKHSPHTDKLLVQIMKAPLNEAREYLETLGNSLTGGYELVFQQTHFPGLSLIAASRLVEVYNQSGNWKGSLSVLTGLRDYAQKHPSNSPISHNSVVLAFQIAYLKTLLGDNGPMISLFRIYSETMVKTAKKKSDHRRQCVLERFKAALEEQNKRQILAENDGEKSASAPKLPYPLNQNLGGIPQTTIVPSLQDFNEPKSDALAKEQRYQRHLKNMRLRAEGAAEPQAAAADEPQAAAAADEPQAAAADEPQAAAAGEVPQLLDQKFREIGIKLTAASLRVDEQISSREFRFSRDQYYSYLGSLGCNERNGKGSHAIAELPVFRTLPNGEYLGAFLEEGEDVGGSAILPKWEGDHVPHYLKSQITDQRRRIFNYHQAIFKAKQAERQPASFE